MMPEKQKKGNRLIENTNRSRFWLKTKDKTIDVLLKYTSQNFDKKRHFKIVAIMTEKHKKGDILIIKIKR